MLPILQIGPLAIPLPAVLLLLTIWVGMRQVEKLASQFKADSNQMSSLVMIGLVTGVIGARLAYVLRFPDAFAGAPLSILTPRPMMFDLSGGLLAGALAALIYGQRKQMPLWITLDALTPALAVFGVGLGLSQLASGDAYGAATQLPWGIELWGAVRHPTQLYTVIAALLIAAFVWPRKVQQTRSIFSNPGITFLVFIALSASALILIETYRGDSALVAGSLRMAQVMSWVILAASLGFIGRRLRDQESEAAASLEELRGG